MTFDVGDLVVWYENYPHISIVKARGNGIVVKKGEVFVWGGGERTVTYLIYRSDYSDIVYFDESSLGHLKDGNAEEGNLGVCYEK
jgi:hypothetical protein